MNIDEKREVALSAAISQLERVGMSFNAAVLRDMLPAKPVTLELSREAAIVLMAVLANVGGNPNGPRWHVDVLIKRLRDAGYDYPAMGAVARTAAGATIRKILDGSGGAGTHLPDEWPE